MPGPNFISQAELDQMRYEQRLMIQEIGGFGTIKRPTVTPNGRGGWTNDYVEFPNIPMRLWISAGPEGTTDETEYVANQESSQTVAFVTLAWDVDIQLKDHIEYDNRAWEVLGTQYPDTFHTAIRVRVTAIRE